MNFNFRAWDMTTNKMRECYGFNVLENLAFVCNVANDELKGREKTVHAVKRQLDDVNLMQSTGLYDFNGKEVYEWDIVEMKPNVYADPKNYLVFQHYGGEYRLEAPSNGSALWLKRNKFKVVGNVFENPELMDKDFVERLMREVERWRGILEEDTE